jgi:phage baseplate assembly protein W
MVVTIDEMLESKEPILLQEVKDLHQRARTLLEVNEGSDDSRRSYFEALQREPDVILAHAAVMKVVNV